MNPVHPLNSFVSFLQNIGEEIVNYLNKVKAKPTQIIFKRTVIYMRAPAGFPTTYVRFFRAIVFIRTVKIRLADHRLQ
jgi:hypothetical protein